MNFLRINGIKTSGFWVSFYLFMSIVPFPMWIFPKSLIYFISLVSLVGLFVFWGVKRKLVITHFTLSVAVGLLVFLFYTTLPLFGRSFDWPTLLRFAPFLPMIFFMPKILFYAFLYFRKLNIVVAGFAIIIFFLLLVGIDLPYYKIDGFSLPMERGNDYYRLYGIVVSSTNTVYEIFGLTIARACGPYQEPGHFGIYLGIVLSIEKLLFEKVSKLPVIAGFLTFSPAFLAILLLIIAYDVILKRRFKFLLGLTGGLIFLFSVILVDSTMREVVYYLAIGRNFTSIEQAALDERAGNKALSGYKNFVDTNKVYTGMGVDWVNENYGVLSDFRGYIFRLGIIGFALSIILLLIIIFYKFNSHIVFLLLPIAILIHAHRFWMFTAPYIYILFFIGVQSSIYFNSISGKIPQLSKTRLTIGSRFSLTDSIEKHHS